MHVFTHNELVLLPELVGRHMSDDHMLGLPFPGVCELHDKLASDIGGCLHTSHDTRGYSLESANLDDDLTCVGDRPGKGEVDSLYLDQILAQLAHLCERLTEELPYAESVNVNAVSRATILSHMIDDYLGGA